MDTRTSTTPERSTDARLVEPGAAFAELAGPTPPRAAGPDGTDRYDVIVIGAGQAGLSIGYYLARKGLRFVILDANQQIGDAWRRRWDSLRLFTPARYDGLDGMPFPAPPHYFPTKDEMADYLESYAAHFSLPVVTGVRVERLWRRGNRYVVGTGERRLEADQVVVAMGHYQRPKIPEFAYELSDDIAQLHSADYHNPSQLKDGPVLLVGAGNSAAELAKELSPHHRIWMSGPSTGKLPFRVAGPFGRLIGVPLVLKVLFMRVLSVSNPIGRKARPKLLGAGPLIRVLPKDLRRMGVERVGRTTGTKAGKPLLDDGRVLDVANVIWCSGFHSAFSWIDLPIFDDHGHPRHHSGIVDEAPGLYFLGLHFLHSMSSDMVHGVGRDARRLSAAIAERLQATAGARPTAAVSVASWRQQIVKTKAEEAIQQRKDQVMTFSSARVQQAIAEPGRGESLRRRLLAGIPVTETRATFAGISTAFLTGGDGPPMVLLHGPGESSVNWRWVIPELVREYRVIAPDLPAHGSSDVGAGELDADRILAWLGELIAQTCDSPPVLVGQVLGGAIAARFGVSQGRHVRRIVLVDSLGLGRFRPSMRFAFRFIAFAALPTEHSYARFMNQCAYDLESLRSGMHDWDSFAAYNLELARSPKSKAASRLFKKIGLPRIPPEDLARIEVPTSLIWGRQDRALRLRIAERASAAYGWPLHVVEEAADDPPRDQPEAFINALRAAVADA